MPPRRQLFLLILIHLHPMAGGVAQRPALPDSVSRQARDSFQIRTLDPVALATLEAREGPDDGAAEDGPFFYRGGDVGSDAYVGPLDVLLNKGFDLAQLSNRERTIFDYSYGWEHVGHALTRPGHAIQRIGGWKVFLRTQILPITYDEQDSKWVPNYLGHALTGGIISRRLSERLEAAGVPFPQILGGATTLAAALLNEAYEHPELDVGTAGTVADLYVFDLGGVLLFANDAVARFFARKARATVWPAQASVALPSGRLVNNGNHLIMKFPLFFTSTTSVFFRTGLSGQWGLTYHHPSGLDLSYAAGFEANELTIDEETGAEVVNCRPTVGFFVDRNGSLLASLSISMIRDRLVSINVYPGVLGGADRGIGGWLVIGEEFRVEFGLSSRRWLGAGLGLGW